MIIKFFGVRGSIPTPLTPAEVELKVAQSLCSVYSTDLPSLDTSKPTIHPDNIAIMQSWLSKRVPSAYRSTHGGNTTCLEIDCDGYPLILDMGTGLREQGKAMLPKILAEKRCTGTILQSHLHWDHIQGCPFWAPLFMPNSVFDNQFNFFGGKSWDSQLEVVLSGQMDFPTFPVRLDELRATAMKMNFGSIYDGWKTVIPVEHGEIEVLARKLNHPQETFGYRITYRGNTIAFTTDHEPYADGVPNGLKELVDGVDVYITDCQYSHDMYLGKKDGIQKLGWGHSYPEYIAEIAKECKPGRIITTHHDPSSTDLAIEEIATDVESLSNISTVSAFEGMNITL